MPARVTHACGCGGAALQAFAQQQRSLQDRQHRKVFVASRRPFAGDDPFKRQDADGDSPLRARSHSILNDRRPLGWKMALTPNQDAVHALLAERRKESAKRAVLRLNSHLSSGDIAKNSACCQRS
jgi:hypothetical protein